MGKTAVATRIGTALTGKRLTLGDRTFDPVTSTLRGPDGAELRLRNQSVRILTLLVEAKGHLVDREHLIATVWPGIAVTDDSLVQCIRDIRVALNDTDRQILKTVIGRGYSLNVSAQLDLPRRKMPTVFVAPFATSDDNDLAGDLHEECHDALIARLVPRVGLQLISNPGRQDEADYLVTGRIKVKDDKVRISFRLGQTVDQVVFFNDSRNALAHETSGLADEVADVIAAQLRVHMIVNDGAAFVQRDNEELTVQQLKAKAAWHMARFQRENRVEAQNALCRACDLSPEDPIAMAMLASMSTQLVPLVPFDEVLSEKDTALELADKAVEAGQSIDYVLRTRGNIRLWLHHDHDGARRDCERALQLNPAFHLAHLTIAESEIMSGEMSAGIARLKNMMHRAPVDPQNPLYFSMIALGEVLAGRPDEACAAATESYELWPTQPWAALVHSVACAFGDQAAAAPTRDLVRGLPEDHFRRMPFVDASHVTKLERLLETART